MLPLMAYSEPPLRNIVREIVTSVYSIGRAPSELSIVSTTSAQHQQTASLRRRIADLENEVLRLKVENDGLLAALRERVDLVSASDLAEPVSH